MQRLRGHHAACRRCRWQRDWSGGCVAAKHLQDGGAGNMIPPVAAHSKGGPPFTWEGNRRAVCHLHGLLSRPLLTWRVSGGRSAVLLGAQIHAWAPQVTATCPRRERRSARWSPSRPSLAGATTCPEGEAVAGAGLRVATALHQLELTSKGKPESAGESGSADLLC